MPGLEPLALIVRLAAPAAMAEAQLRYFRALEMMRDAQFGEGDRNIGGTQRRHDREDIAFGRRNGEGGARVPRI